MTFAVRLFSSLDDYFKFNFIMPICGGFKNCGQPKTMYKIASYKEFRKRLALIAEEITEAVLKKVTVIQKDLLSLRIYLKTGLQNH